MSPPTTGGKNVAEQNGKISSNSIHFATNFNEFLNFLNILCNWAKKHVLTHANITPTSSGGGTLSNKVIAPRTSSSSSINNLKNKEALKTPLSTRFIIWMHPSSYFPTYWEQIVQLQYGHLIISVPF
jgi:hypothetical protein